MEIVNVKMASDQLYAVPAEIVNCEGTKALVRFAAGNVRLVDFDLLTTATEADRKEFESATARWRN